MKARSLDNTLAQAITAMSALSEREIQKLSLRECCMVLTALPDIAELKGVRKHLASLLSTRLSARWIKEGAMYEVFSVLIALWNYHPMLVTGECIAHAVQRLVATEVSTGGPYRSNNKIETTTNIQIAHFVRLVAKPLPRIEELLTKVVVAKDFQDAELTLLGLLYLMSKVYTDSKLRNYIGQHWQKKDWQTPAATAIAFGILKDSIPQSQIELALARISKQQQSNGFWKATSLFQTPTSPTVSAIVASALVMEVLGQYRRPKVEKNLKLQHRHQKIIRIAKQQCNDYTEPLRSSAIAAINQVSRADRNFEITLLPYFFGYALKTLALLTNQQYIKLGLANLYGWVAYTIYDDFLDNEGTPEQLPIANVAMRTSLEYFRATLPHDRLLQRYITTAFTDMDGANAWEVAHCRLTVQGENISITKLPKYYHGKVLAAQSFAHALGPLAVLAHHPANSAQKMHTIESAFRHYLIARQLNDDLRDWLQDIRTGQASYVVTAILRDMRIQTGTYNLAILLPIMQRCFRQTTISKVCQRILWHITSSRQAFAKSQLLHTTNDIYRLLDTLEISVQYSLDRLEKSRTFAKERRKDIQP